MYRMPNNTRGNFCISQVLFSCQHAFVYITRNANIILAEPLTLRLVLAYGWLVFPDCVPSNVSLDFVSPKIRVNAIKTYQARPLPYPGGRQ